MRSVVVAASLLAGIVLLTPARAAAQDPEPPPPPQQPPAEVAPPRAPDPAQVRESPRGEVRAPRFREPSDDTERNRRPERAVERPVREPAADTAPTRRHVVPTDEGPSRRPVRTEAATVAADDQGAVRRGAVRRPPSDGSGAQPVDRAVPRSEAPAPPPTRTTIVRSYPYRYYPSYSPYFDPWGYGSFGVGYFYYSPWTWAPYTAYGYGSSYPYYSGAFGFDVGSVRLKVKPRDAEVWVNGYYAGTVDDFDGTFQALKLDMGAYRIEIRKAGFESLTFDVRVQPERTITFRGELKPAP